MPSSSPATDLLSCSVGAAEGWAEPAQGVTGDSYRGIRPGQRSQPGLGRPALSLDETRIDTSKSAVTRRDPSDVQAKNVRSRLIETVPRLIIPIAPCPFRRPHDRALLQDLIVRSLEKFGLVSLFQASNHSLKGPTRQCGVRPFLRRRS